MPTLASLVTRVREKVDEDVAAFWTDTVINNQLIESYRYYWSFIIKLHEGYFNKIVNISFDGNANGEYALPSDYAKTRLVSRILSNEKIPLRYLDRWDSAISKTLGNSTFNLPTYRFRGNYIVFEPAPDFSETDAVEHEYTPVLTDLSASQDTDSGFPALALDCVVIRAVIKCKGIEEMVAGGGADRDPFIQDLLTTEQNLKELLEHRTNQRAYVEQFGLDDDSW
mgnify:CR=1 FL=1